jgi:hypothetical protein
MTRKGAFLYFAFIMRSAAWGLLLGVIGGFIVTLWMMVTIPLTTWQNELRYTLQGASFGTITGALHGLFLAFLTELVETNPRRRFDYHGMLVMLSILFVFILSFGIIAETRPFLTTGFNDYVVRGFVFSLILGVAGGFIAHQNARWYLGRGKAKKKKGIPTLQEGPGEPHPSRSDDLDDEENQQRDVDADEHVRDHQHRFL